MTKLIAALFIAAFLYVGWLLYLRWDKVRNEEETSKKQAVAAQVRPENLAGMPNQSQQMENSLRAAQEQGPTAFKNWLKTYGRSVQDPRKAWIQLDYCLAISREDPAEAKRIFAEVKGRTPATSPVYPRIKQLENTYE
ncbi:MAG TPA: hypothetical protein VN578_20610 [Candidatus Binatia bacterium]|jgi:hypothetical protein|nr:hypothetical protein [Candidatus Binatia bacterium]